MKAKFINEYTDWTGKWIPDKESAFDKAHDYSLKENLVKELIEITKKYQGKIKDKTIVEALNYVIKRYNIL